MERKRKLPARAAARVDQLSKRRTLTPPERRSATPAPPLERESTPAQEVKPPLPKSIQAGKPLPTVEDAQPSDLPDREYQSIAERLGSTSSSPNLYPSLTLALVVSYPIPSHGHEANGSAKAFSRNIGRSRRNARASSLRNRITLPRRA